jgi:hypothetical protein
VIKRDHRTIPLSADDGHAALQQAHEQGGMPPGARKIAKVLRSLEKIRSTAAMGTKSSMAALGYVAYVQQLIQPPCRWLTEHGPQPPPVYVLLNPASSNLPNRGIKKPFDRAQRFQRPILITAPISHFRVVLFIKRHVSETTFAVQNPAGSGRRQAVPLHGIVAR